jgi:hypothetical protein
MADEVNTLYPHLREVLDPRFDSLTDAELEDAFGSAFGEGVTPAEYEEFFDGLGRNLGKFLQQAGPVLATAGQGAMAGGAAGSALGPYGALVGALAGGTGAVLGQHGSGTARDVGNVLNTAVKTTNLFTGRGGGPVTGSVPATTNAPAAANLLGLLSRPETAQALRALAGGRNTAVPVGTSGTPAPANAFAGLLAALAGQADAEAAFDDAEGVAAYLVTPSGRLAADPADPDQRAARLLVLLAQPVAAGTESDDAFDDAELYEDAELDDDAELYEPTRW